MAKACSLNQRASFSEPFAVDGGTIRASPKQLDGCFGLVSLEARESFLTNWRLSEPVGGPWWFVRNDSPLGLRGFSTFSAPENGPDLPMSPAMTINHVKFHYKSVQVASGWASGGVLPMHRPYRLQFTARVPQASSPGSLFQRHRESVQWIFWFRLARRMNLVQAGGAGCGPLPRCLSPRAVAP